MVTQVEPEVWARPATDAETPAGARWVAALAEANGWTVVATFARGTRPSQRPRIVDNLALRMSRGRQRAVAVWVNARFESAFTWGEHPIRRCNNTALRTALRREAGT
jgi:hypothetical protein